MSDSNNVRSLDPVDWEDYRAIAHEMLDRMLDHQRQIAEEPAWRQVPEAVEKRFHEPAPRRGIGAERSYEDFVDLVLPYRTGNAHPRFWGWVSGTGSPSGMVAEMLTAGINSCAGHFNDSAARVEQQVVDWMRTAMGMPGSTSGVLTSGGSVANLIGLAAARDAKAATDVALHGVDASTGRLTLYTSHEVHSSVAKAAQVLGLGRDAVRTVAVDEEHRVILSELERAIAQDRANGDRPFAVVGNAGTVNTGAVDDLNALADIAEREDLWFHVDGAFAALVRLSERYRHRVAGMERADSLAFDFHKWMYVPYEAGCVLVRDPESHQRPFTVDASYLATLPRGVAAQPDSTNLKSLQLSRGSKALKVWLLIKEHGLDRYAQLIERNIEQVARFAARIEADPYLQLIGPVPLNIACFRFVDPALDEENLNALNREILMRLHEEGTAVPSSTTLDGRFALRVANTNHRSADSDFELLARRTVEIGDALAGAEGRGDRALATQGEY